MEDETPTPDEPAPVPVLDYRTPSLERRGPTFFDVVMGMFCSGAALLFFLASVGFLAGILTGATGGAVLYVMFLFCSVVTGIAVIAAYRRFRGQKIVIIDDPRN